MMVLLVSFVFSLSFVGILMMQLFTSVYYSSFIQVLMMQPFSSVYSSSFIQVMMVQTLPLPVPCFSYKLYDIETYLLVSLKSSSQALCVRLSVLSISFVQIKLREFALMRINICLVSIHYLFFILILLEYKFSVL